ncbi:MULTISPECIES: bacterio-opsin activator domain-containing protein [Halorussus]|uniref:helix-turn-helix domain-containing protein n=1 Tax=Halorussus TaxID=1070314 RepID=UPI000E20E877|nr:MULTISPECIES: bacterio-opsin activator domain-containing protein [Halorussus]NHN59729.1 bacterio-opsin activator [Halorussus sp. JP-T4]
MSVIAELSVPVEDFPLGRALAATPELEVELERIVPTGDATLPFFWVWGDDVEAFVAALEDEDGVDSVTVLDRVSDGALLRATWTDEAGLVEAVVDSEATLLSVARRDGEWRFQLRSPDREAVADLQRYCAAHDIDLRLNWIHSVAAVEAGEQYGLTDDQRAAVVAAFGAGYFDEPRGTTLEELSAEFDISPRAVSKRMRRGLRNLVAATLATEE